MGFLDRFRRTTTTATQWTPGNYPGSWVLSTEDQERILGLSPAEMWRTQPYLRTVVTFLARNIAQLGLQAFQRLDEDNRVRVRDGVGEVFSRPNFQTTSYELVYGLVADLALYDTSYLLVTEDPDQRLTRLPVRWVTPKGGDAWGPAEYHVQFNNRGESVVIPADKILAFHGWHPGALSHGSTPVSALKEILAEQVQAARYREAVWKRGGKVGSVLTRPAGAPSWSPEARSQFKADWDSQFTGNGPRVGGTPLLEDGMTLGRVDFNAQEMQFIEGARLALNTVASVYHVNPTMIGLLDNANYSNVREFRRMLYGDTLGPTIAQLEDRLNTFLIPKLDTRPGIYVEFNIEEKLQGSFEEQTAALQASVGRPWMTANEARALRNMPALEDGDGLVTPLNVLVGGQASPQDSAPPQAALQEAPTAASRAPEAKAGQLFLLKAKGSQSHADEVAEVLSKFFDRQGSKVLSVLGAGGEDWWDEDRWDKELSDDLHKVSLSVSEVLGKAEAEALGYPEEYDTEATANFLRAASDRYAHNVNTTTKGKLDRAVEDGTDPGDVYAPEAKSNRAVGVATGVATFLAGFATHEAGTQLARAHDKVGTKTWITGANPRADHAEMDGETVSLDEDFSNGAKWPGSSTGDPSDSANCNCSVSIDLA